MPTPKIIDISQPLTPAVAVWPGDTEFKPFWVMRMVDGDSVNVGSVTMSLHTGTHTDAPLHIIDDGTSTSELPLDPFVGMAQVIDLREQLKDRQPCGITTNDLEPLVGDAVERLLIRSDTASIVEFATDAAFLTQDAAEWLVSRGVKLVGLDTPSIDASDSKELPVHHTFINAGLCWLENLYLADVDPGQYELIALPLKILNMDAAPVRAILRTT